MKKGIPQFKAGEAIGPGATLSPIRDDGSTRTGAAATHKCNAKTAALMIINRMLCIIIT
jgi:hypothetical protein